MIYHTHGGEYANSLRDLKQEVAQAVEIIKPWIGAFDSIIARGMSGITLGVGLSLALNVPLCIVRKDEEFRHSSSPAIGERDLGVRTLFVDDFICGGATYRACESFAHSQGARIAATYESKSGGIFTPK